MDFNYDIDLKPAPEIEMCECNICGHLTEKEATGKCEDCREKEGKKKGATRDRAFRKIKLVELCPKDKYLSIGGK